MRLYRTPHTFKVGGVVLACISFFSGGFAAAMTDNYSSHFVQSDLAAAYAAATAGKPASSAQAARSIRLAEPDYQVVPVSSHAAGYQLVRAANRPTIAVRVADGQVELIARRSSYHRAVVAEVGDLSGPGSQHALWTGNLDWKLIAEVVGPEIAVWLLLLAFAFADDNQLDKRLRAVYRQRSPKLRRRWAELVPADGVYGPKSAEVGFSLWVAEFDEHDEGPYRVTFRARRFRWDGAEWCEVAGVRSPSALEQVSVRRGVGIGGVSEQWSEFCHRVASENAARWRDEQRSRDERARVELAQAEAARQEAERLALERGELKELLKPGPEMVRGLVVPESVS